MSSTVLQQTRLDLAGRLMGRRAEIEQLVLTRVYGIAEPSGDPEYHAALRAAVSAAVDYGFSAVEGGEQQAAEIPPILLMQARIAARSGVSLDTVLRRYFAGYALLADFLLDEAERCGGEGIELKRLLRESAGLLDRLLAAVSDEHSREVSSHLGSAEKRRLKRVERLLAGELLDLSEFNYDFKSHHVGVVATGPEREEVVRETAAALDRRLLTIRPDEKTVWAWLGGRHELGADAVAAQAERVSSRTATVAVGEPGETIEGWRLSHLQAKAALPVASLQRSALVRYADVALVASMLKDDVLATSLRDIYLKPLEQARGGGEAARSTLRAYFAAEGNLSSAAAALGVNRHTVRSRLRAVEARVGRSLSVCSAELYAALRLDAMLRARMNSDDGHAPVG